MLLILVTTIHVIMCLILIAIVLLQTGKGADMGAAFGGATQTLFGGAGPANFLNKVTTVAAIVFMLTSLSLAIISSKSDSSSKVLEASPVQKTQPVAAQTATPAVETTTVPAADTTPQTQPSAEATTAPTVETTPQTQQPPVEEQKAAESAETAPQATPTE